MWGLKRAEELSGWTLDFYSLFLVIKFLAESVYVLLIQVRNKYCKGGNRCSFLRPSLILMLFFLFSFKPLAIVICHISVYHHISIYHIYI